MSIETLEPGAVSDHLEAALDQIEDEDARYHVRQALQILATAEEMG